MKYSVRDEVRIKRPHSCGDTVFIQEVDEEEQRYKVYIPYWGYFYIDDNDIIEKVSHI
jgi:hypothetical protein